MSVTSREKLALAVFALLIVLSLCGLGWYLFAGHSWNVAASNIDDTFGSMDGYAAIVYDGTAQARIDENPSRSSAADQAATLTLDDVRQSYEDKQASVFAIDTVNASRYSEGVILKKGDRRCGVFSVSKPLTRRAVENYVSYFNEHEVDFVVAVVADKDFVVGGAGVDVVVSTRDDDVLAMGENVDGTFFVDAPEKGKVGAVLISPSNVVSAKVIEDVR